jgi:FADH2 O2-dependent halogenase
MQMDDRYDIAVIGSGFAGSIMAMIARRLGYSVVLIEKHEHPRVVVGESSTPLSNLLLEELAKTYDLPMLLPLTKWGSWQREHPELSCGLKRGFSFFHHVLGSSSSNPTSADNQLFVAASPHDEIADTHWFRADLDHFLAKQAQLSGAIYIDRFIVEHCHRDLDSWTLSGQRASIPLSVNATFLIDASGPNGFLHRALNLAETALPGYPATSSLYCHFTNVEALSDNTRHSFVHAPFPIDDAAVHHVFEGGWIWVLRFNNEWTSAGIAATEPLSRRFQLSEGKAAWHKVLESLPMVKRQFANATPVTPFTYVPQLSFMSESFTGEGWAMLPTAAAFVDPLLSTGFPLTLLGIQRLAVVLAENVPLSQLSDRLGKYTVRTRSEQLATARLVGSLYKNMANFPVFRSLSLLYFAAASYSETARRLGRSNLANSFLLAGDPLFSLEFNRILDLSEQQMDEPQEQALEHSIYHLIEKYDVAGLCKRPHNHCYPVMAEDLYDAAHKLGARESDIDELLYRSGFSVASAILPS